MPDFSPWGAAAQSGMGGYQYPQPVQQPVSGFAAGAGAIPQMNNFSPTPMQQTPGGLLPSQGGAVSPPPSFQGQVGGPQSAMGPGNPIQMMQQANQNQWGSQPGQGFSNMGSSPLNRPGGMNPLMGFLLPFLMQRMGVGGRQGGAPGGPSFGPSSINISPYSNPQMNGQLGSVGAPQNYGIGNSNMPQGQSIGGVPGLQGIPSPRGAPQMVPGGNMLYGPGGQPPMQTKSPFEMPNLGGIQPVPIQGSPVGSMPPGQSIGSTPGLVGLPSSPPVAPGSDKASYYGNQPPVGGTPPPTSPEAQMQQQAQQMALNQSLTDMGMNNPMGAQMANLLRQQLMGQLGY